MKTSKFIILLCMLLILVPSCKHQKELKKIVYVSYHYPPTTSIINIYQTGQQLPNNIIRIGSVVVGEAGLTPAEKCTYEACIRAIEDEARKAGADLIYLVKVKEPDRLWGSTCYDITAELYKYTDNQ